ncbi:DUF1244 domain-containing protein [Glaciecola siphonariae]|uniref:DUF1244 domain-containing protein n=1 Tax=Glaciecola siphonariae TaxID=521012 RepID=A0ABV9LRI1_9ALTE
MDSTKQTEIEAATLRRLLNHLDNNKDVQNIDLMIVADFCRNCLSRWYMEEAQKHGEDVSDAQAREHIYKMPYSEWKEKHQTAASEEQLAAFNARAKSKQAR